MNIHQVDELVKQGESQRLEFKKSTTQLKAAFETVCALLNGKGGTILLGVRNNGEIIGQDASDKTHQEIAKLCHKISSI